MKSHFSRVVCLIILAGCGNPLQEAKQSLQGSWMDGRFLDSLEATGSPYRATISLHGVSDLRYDATYDSIVVGYYGHASFESKGLALSGDDSVRIGGVDRGMTIPSPQWADRMLVQGVELRRVSRVFQLTMNEYILRKYFHGKYRFLGAGGSPHKDTVVIEGSGSVKGLGEITNFAVVTDYQDTRIVGDAASFESIFVTDTLYYHWNLADDTLHLEWIPHVDRKEIPPPSPPGPKFALVRLRDK
jgi:hypothetical protein